MGILGIIGIIGVIIGIIVGIIEIVDHFKKSKLKESKLKESKPKISFNGPISSFGIPTGIQMISFEILNKGNATAYFTSNPSFIAEKTDKGYPILFPYGLSVNPKLPCKLEPSQKLSVYFPREGFINSIKELRLQKFQLTIKDDIGTTYKSEYINSSKF